MVGIWITNFLVEDVYTGLQETSNLAVAESLNSQTNIHILWVEIQVYELNFNIHWAPD